MQIIAPTEFLMDPVKMKSLPLVDRKNPAKKYTEKEEKWLREVGTYEFSNKEQSGSPLSFEYGSTRNKMILTFLHGGRYTIPRFIANHVNECSTPRWKWRPDGTGRMHKELDGFDNRFHMREVYAA